MKSSTLRASFTPVKLKFLVCGTVALTAAILRSIAGVGGGFARFASANDTGCLSMFRCDPCLDPVTSDKAPPSPFSNVSRTLPIMVTDSAALLINPVL